MESGFHPMAKSRVGGDFCEMKILRASASTDFCVTKDCRIIHHPEHGKKCLEVGNKHWIPVVSWVRLQPEHHLEDEPGDDGSTDGPDGFHELESSEQVVWVEKPKNGQ